MSRRSTSQTPVARGAVVVLGLAVLLLSGGAVPVLGAEPTSMRAPEPTPVREEATSELQSSTSATAQATADEANAVPVAESTATAEPSVTPSVDEPESSEATAAPAATDPATPVAVEPASGKARVSELAPKADGGVSTAAHASTSPAPAAMALTATTTTATLYNMSSRPVEGSPVRLRVSVSPKPAVSGSITVTDDLDPSITTTSSYPSTTGILVSFGTLPVGPHALRAAFSGSGTLAPSTSAPVNVKVLGATTTSLTTTKVSGRTFSFDVAWPPRRRCRRRAAHCRRRGDDPGPGGRRHGGIGRDDL